jgi:hypothetical protein
MGFGEVVGTCGDDLPHGSGNGFEGVANENPGSGPESRLWAAGAGRVHDARTARPDGE